MRRNFCPNPASACVEDAEKGVSLRISGAWPLDELVLSFPSAEDLGNWLNSSVANAVQKYREEKANTPAKVIERALEGSYRDRETQAEMILEDLRAAGHVVIDANIKSSSGQEFLEEAADKGKVQVLPDDDDLVEEKNWLHPVTGYRWDLDNMYMRDGLGDVWCWAGGWESGRPGYMWPLLSRKDWAVIDIRWDVVEANGPLVPLMKSS